MKQEQREPNSKERFQPNAAETAALKNHIRKRGRPTAPRIKVNGTASFSIDHPDPFLGRVLLMEAIGTVDHDFFRGLLRQLINGSVRAGQIDECSVNFMVAVIKGIKPRDDLEIMLATQMAAIHDAFMRATQALANATTIPEQDSAERLLNKLARTFATQMEALQRYRNGGGHKVTVQQVSVNDGGQAIVGDVTQSQRRETGQEPPAAAPAVIPFEPRRAVAVLDPDGARKPIPIERIRKPQKVQSKK
jgi:hypothetical protein